MYLPALRLLAVSGAAVQAGSGSEMSRVSTLARKFNVMTARELLAMPDPESDVQLLGPLVKRGQRVVIGAHTGEGKSTLCLGIARAIMAGEDFLGYQGIGEARALYIDAEQGLGTIKRRLREARITGDSLDYLAVPDGLTLDSDEDERRAMEAIFEAGRYSLVFCDPLYKLHRGDSNDERAAVDLMRQFDTWRERFGFALVLPVHCRKPPMQGRFTIHDLFGSSAYTRGAEVVLGLRRVRPGEGVLYFFKDRDGDLPVGDKWSLNYSHQTGYSVISTEQPKTRRAHEVIAGLLESTPSSTVAELAKAGKYSEGTVSRALRTIEAVQDESWPRRYWLPDEA
jgi:AAA domain